MRIRMLVLLLVCGAAFAQENAVERARQLAIGGHRREALQMLEQRIASAPDDVDGQVLYGVILSWERDFDHARRVLQWVLLRQPQNDDARLALRNVELWSKQPSRAAPAQSEATIGGTYDDFGNSDPWREEQIALKREFRFGPATARAAYGHRFGLDDEQLDLDWYPRLGSKRYAYLDVAYSPHARLYPRLRLGAELFQAFGRGFEASLGYRRLNFSDAANVYTASFSKYYGNWLFTARDFRSENTNTLQGMIRRYLSGVNNYLGLRFGRGATREDLRSITDIEVVDSFYAIGEARLGFRDPWFLQLAGGAGRLRAPGGHQRHQAGSVLLGIKF